jgi:hypothetical protein
VLPNGTPQKMTIGDYRQLSDALFHAGTDSGSEYEYVDQANRLHFYVLDVRRDGAGVLSYTVAVRSLDGAGPHQRGVTVFPTSTVAPPREWTRCTVFVRNTGKAAAVPPGHPEDVTTYVGADVYRISATASDIRATTWLPTTVTTVRFGEFLPVHVFVKRAPDNSNGTEVKIDVTSESDPTKHAVSTCRIR